MLRRSGLLTTSFPPTFVRVIERIALAEAAGDQAAFAGHRAAELEWEVEGDVGDRGDQLPGLIDFLGPLRRVAFVSAHVPFAEDDRLAGEDALRAQGPLLHIFG